MVVEPVFESASAEKKMICSCSLNPSHLVVSIAGNSGEGAEGPFNPDPLCRWKVRRGPVFLLQFFGNYLI